MSLLFQDDDFEVHDRFFGGYYVILRSRGVTIKPTLRLTEALGFIWIKVRRMGKADPPIGRLAEDLLMRLFAEACIDPSGQIAVTLIGTDPTAYALFCIDTARIKANFENDLSMTLLERKLLGR